MAFADDEFIGINSAERDEILENRKKRKIILCVIFIVIAVALFLAIIGLVFIIDVNGDTAKGPDNTNNPTPTASPSVSSTITNLNNKDYDINERYYANAEIHPFTVDDLIRTDRIGEPVTSRDDTMFAFTRYVYNPATNVSSTTLWIQEIASVTSPRQLTPFGWSISEGNPCWSPDGKTLLFISNRDPANLYYPGETSQVWQINTEQEGVLPSMVSAYAVSVNALTCSNTGAFFAFAANVIPGHTIDESAIIIQEKESETVRAFTFEKLFIRHWGEWFHGERSHVFLQPISWNSGDCAIIGAPTDLIFNVDADVPSKPFGGIEEWSFDPTDTEFSFVRRYDESSSVAWTNNLDIFSVSISATGDIGVPQCVTADNLSADNQPSYSPDGQSMAYVSQTVPGYESDRFILQMRNRNSGETQAVSQNWDRSIDSFVWLPDSSGFYVTIGEHAREKIYSITTEGVTTPVVEDHSSNSLNVLQSGDIVFAYDSMTEPTDIYLTSNGTLRQLVSFNDGMLSKTYRSQPIEFWFTGANEDQVHSWVLSAADGSAPGENSFPVAFLIHGGPQGTWSDDWSYRWNPQTYAGHGYAVAMIDFHGSTGYGQNFTDSITNDYGGAPFQDLNIGLDAMLRIFNFMDGSRQVALGASYGGWMINWINGHPWNDNDRFICLVCHDGIFDERFFWFDTEELWFPEHDMVGTAFNNSNYNTWNPSLFADQWNTPQLVIHGGRDYRIPDSHGIGAFTALQRRGIESKFVFFPTENHWVQTPANSVFWHTAVQDWMDHFAYPDGHPYNE